MAKTKNNTESPKLLNIVVVGKFSDGKCRQVLINPKTQDVVLSAIKLCEGEIRALETVIEGIDISLLQKQTSYGNKTT